MKTTCDKCGAVFSTVLPETYRENDIEITFFIHQTPGSGSYLYSLFLRLGVIMDE